MASVYDIMNTDTWLGVGESIEKKDLNVDAKFWSNFIRSTIIPSQNESILLLTRASYLRSIMYMRSIDLGLLISQKITKMAKQTHISLSFLVLVNELCRRPGVHRDPDRKITPIVVTHIQLFEEE